MPGTPGNTNSVKHGLRSKRYGLVHAKLGKRFAAAYGHVNQLRRAVESHVVERHGGLSLLQQAKIQSLLRLEEGIRACEKLMAESPKMDAAEVRQQRYAIAQWTCQRDSLLAELLGGDSPTANPWDIFDAQRAQIATQAHTCDTSPASQSVATENENTTVGHTGAQEGNDQ